MFVSNSVKSVACALLAVAGSVGTSMVAQANTNAFYVPSFRGEAGSAVAGWDFFTVGYGTPGNAPDLAGSTATSARLAQLNPDAFVTGSGNIYNQPSVSSFTISYTASAALSFVVLQTRTIGTELDYSSVSLSYAGGTLAGVRTELARDPFVGQGPGAIVSSAWTWDLSGVKTSDLTISFKGDGPSVSFDSATLDVRTTPEPGTWALLLVGLAAGGFFWRRTR